MIRKHQNKIRGIRGAKPRFSSAKPNGKQTEAEAEYLEVRNRGQRAKAMTAEMELARRRGELISRALVEQQASYILASLRAKILTIPQTWARRLASMSVSGVQAALKEMARQLCNDLANFPEQITDPNWLRTLEKDDGK
jgi:phage terminase Nu1 subunit (DNA packaging protein)